MKRNDKYTIGPGNAKVSFSVSGLNYSFSGSDAANNRAMRTNGDNKLFIGNGLNVTKDHADVLGDACNVTGDHCKVNGNGCIISGDHCQGEGNGCEIAGDYCRWRGDGCNISGDRCTVTGVNCVITGDHCKVTGKECTFYGRNCTYNGKPVNADSKKAGGGSRWNFSSGTNSGNFVCVQDITQSSDGSFTAIRNSSRGGSSTGDDPPRIAPKRSLADGDRAGEERPKKRKKPKVPDAWPDEPQEAAEGEKECTICCQRGVCTVIDPCRHSYMCVDCARKVGSPDDAKCSLCNAKIKRVERIIVS